MRGVGGLGRRGNHESFRGKGDYFGKIRLDDIECRMEAEFR
jgi:hypothetical protein